MERTTHTLSHIIHNPQEPKKAMLRGSLERIKRAFFIGGGGRPGTNCADGGKMN